jgi:hypothetical protein
MVAPIGKGDWVQALFEGVECPVRKGDVLCVSAVFPKSDCQRCGGCGGLHLYGVPTPHEIGVKGAINEWPSCAFTPLGGNAKTLKAPPARIHKTEDA